jgi:hypothetical protein
MSEPGRNNDGPPKTSIELIDRPPADHDGRGGDRRKETALGEISLVVSSLAFIFSLFALYPWASRNPPIPPQSGEWRPDYTAEIAAVRKDVEKLRQESEINWMVLREDAPRRVVELDPAKKDYSRLDASSGFFLVSCRNVQPYLDGFKVTIRIGNPLNCSFDGFEVGTEWGPRYQGALKDGAAYATWRSAVRLQVFSFPDSLTKGHWNDVDLILAGTKPGDLGYIKVYINTPTASLAIPKERPP